MIRALAITALLLSPAFAAQPCGGHGDPRNMVVSTAWLAAHLRDSNLAILALGDKTSYDRAHIPGAAFLPYTALASRTSPLTLELPSMAELAATFSELGAGNDKRIILYMQGGRPLQATRAYLTLDAMGLGGQTSILDGGMTAWQSEERPVSSESPAIQRGILTPCPQNDVIVDSAYVSSNLRRRGIDVVDARAPEFYSGENTSAGKRPGHIPGAVNIPFQTLADAGGKFLDREALARIFHDAGIQPGHPVVSYCHIGLQATMVYFAARYLGFDARLYDGSWEDWSAKKELPAETAAHN